MDDLGEKEGKQEGESELEREGKLMVVLSLALTMLIDRSIWCFQAPPPPAPHFRSTNPRSLRLCSPRSGRESSWGPFKK
jgi:hypothetical protein